MFKIRFCYSFSYWTSPIVLTVLYRRGYFTSEGIQSLSRFLLMVGILYGAAYLSRGVGRWYNADYVTFIGILTAAQQSLTAQNRRLLSKYDSEFWAWPVDFRWSDVNNGDVKKNKIQTPKSFHKTQNVLYQRQGVRGKVETEDKNQIDTMFVDHRNTGNENGKTLVICCEGNSGFYEIGCTDTPIKEGYSVLGWNHPGFGGSSVV
ncbi:hypothetical protein KUTeg_022548 [Tegillarca granosa]|uniref:Phosphatidylserine Lipase ABHD16 N-terminal domain-containing protein n=1 Tax=Tegillarca granosa TaxID=220873 RepID=A0ABQ9E6Q6_TEGGR|nr:hypothetical protein KUTeg_022548 [Tegillarca granosa]